jgi:type I restriction enzyme S subunit
MTTNQTNRGDQAFKDTEIRRIPKEWEVVEVGSIFSLEYGKGLTETKREAGAYPVFGSNGIVGYHSSYLTKGPGIVVGRKGTIGAINWSDEDFWPIDTTYYVELKRNDIDLKWLYYKLISLNLVKLNMATGVPGLNRELVYLSKIPLPPVLEQRKIASILSTVDEAIQKVDEAIARTERLKRGLMQELLTSPDFKLVKLKEIGKIYTGKTPSTKKEEYWINGKVPFVTPGDLEKSNYVDKTERYISEKGVKEANGLLPKNSVMVVCIGSTIGKVAMNKNGCVTNQQINSIICNSNYDPTYVYYQILLKSKFLKSFSGVAAVPILKKSLFENFEIPVPSHDNPEKSLNEQTKISVILSTVDKKIELERDRKEKLERIKRGLMNDLLTGKKRIKVEG